MKRETEKWRLCDRFRFHAGKGIVFSDTWSNTLINLNLEIKKIGGRWTSLKIKQENWRKLTELFFISSFVDGFNGDGF